MTISSIKDPIPAVFYDKDHFIGVLNACKNHPLEALSLIWNVLMDNDLLADLLLEAIPGGSLYRAYRTNMVLGDAFAEISELADGVSNQKAEVLGRIMALREEVMREVECLKVRDVWQEEELESLGGISCKIDEVISLRMKSIEHRVFIRECIFSVVQELKVSSAPLQSRGYARLIARGAILPEGDYMLHRTLQRAYARLCSEHVNVLGKIITLAESCDEHARREGVDIEDPVVYEGKSFCMGDVECFLASAGALAVCYVSTGSVASAFGNVDPLLVETWLHELEGQNLLRRRESPTNPPEREWSVAPLAHELKFYILTSERGEAE